MGYSGGGLMMSGISVVKEFSYRKDEAIRVKCEGQAF
jgi:hypothetical protein